MYSSIRNLNTIVLVVLLLAGCARPVKKVEIDPPSITKFQCLSAPSSIYQAGTIVRTVVGAVQLSDKVLPDEVTVAWLPIDKPSYVGSFVDFDQDIRSGASATLAGAVLTGLGVTSSLSAGSLYSITIRASNNSNYVADDDLRLATLNKMRSKEGILPNARYFFIKEALGSKDLSYEAKNKLGIVAKVDLNANSSSLAADITARDATSKVHSNRELIACVLLEEMDLAIVSAANGASTFITFDVKQRNASQEDLSVIENIKTAQ